MRPARPNRRYQAALAIDRWVGPPLCALLLALRRLGGMRRTPPAREEVEKVLVLKMWGMGSVVLSSVLFEEIRRQWPRARVEYVTLAENAPVLAFYPEVRHVHTLDLSVGIPRFLLDTLVLVMRLRRERYDVLLDLEFFTRFSAIFSRLVGARCSHGFSARRLRGRLHDVQIPFNAYEHVVGNFLTLLRGDPMNPPPEEHSVERIRLPRLRASRGARRTLRTRLAKAPAWRDERPIVVVNPNAGDMALERRWPAERVVELLEALCARTDANVVLTGSPSERPYVDRLVRASRVESRLVNLAGSLDLAGLVALLERATVVVTNDSGPLHLAAAAGAPVVALFGPETPRLYGPLRAREGQQHAVHYLQLPCSPCMFVHDNKVPSCWFAQARCMTGIGAAEVLHSVEARLEEARGEQAGQRLRPAAEP